MELPKGLHYSLTNVVNMGHIQTFASVQSTEELTTYLKQDREKWRAMFHTCIKLFTQLSMYVYITLVVVIDPRYTLLKSHRSKTGIIYMQAWKQCNLPVITSMASLQLMHLGTWWTELQRYIMRRKHDLPYSHCGSR